MTQSRLLTRVTIPLAFIAGPVLAAGDARAQATGFALDRFEPSERGSEWFTAESLDLRGHMRLALGLVHEGAHRPLAIYNDDGSLRSSLVDWQLMLHPGASLVLWDRLRLSASLPIAVYQSGEAGEIHTLSYAPPGSTSVGDVRLGADVRLLGTYGDPITVAAGVRAFLPSGSRSDYTGDGSVRVEPHLLAAGDIGSFVYAAHVGFEYRGLNDAFGGASLGSQLTFGGAAGARLAEGKLVIGPELYGSAVASSFDSTTTPVEGLLGFHYTAGEFRVGAGAGLGLNKALGSPVARWALSLEWAPPPAPADRDGDGVPDASDACPDVAGVRTDDPKTNGCPPPPPPPPAPPPPADRDGDGVPDAQDACPDVAGVKTDDPKTNGCPADADGDGIPDTQDACPAVAGIKTDDPKTNGCPDPDRDKDGIPNDSDACPDVAGKPDPDPKKNGCPAAYVQGSTIKIVDQVKFATASAKIVDKDKATQAVLEGVLGILRDHPEIKKVRIEGHTDNRGGAAYNKTLSAKRAAAVVEWLIRHGIEPGRLSSVGLGMDRPIDDNGTEAGRANNRRVELHIEEQGPAPSP